MSAQKIESIDIVTAKLSLVEIGLGSIVHGLRIPFGGHLLSLNQGLFLVRAQRAHPHNRWAAIQISNLAALLKTLSPAGSKFGPMISISSQGFLFTVGSLAFRFSILGEIFGMMLLSLWAFIQPVVTLYVLMGQELERMGTFYFEKIFQDYPWAAEFAFGFLLTLVGTKMLVAASIPLLVKYRPATLQRLESKILSTGQSKSGFGYASKKLRLNLLTLFSLGLALLFWIQYESSWTRILWLSLRPLAITFVLWILFRTRLTRYGIIKLLQASKKGRHLLKRGYRVIRLIQDPTLRFIT